ncbi:DNA polymerase III subunit tau [Rosistilla ulvae]|uniref:DNA polymerase III subunit gamma/tau n=1 Tax=Rosistilla ulvae TaxID=1930277 RepID=A0A517LZW5_9BACT|nr:DNA polymerase III subunit gamma/tau [Rosistilla ulvae]QDS88160.1 DNA polymerase III subunit tau [Rosistilla ulvae]
MSDSPASDAKNHDDDKYIVVARRYRPLQFDQLVGQENATRALMNAIETGRVGHAYLFTGARGVGKTSTARIFAKALNAPEGPTATPDNSSDICQAIDAGEDIDVLEIDGASNRGIDEIRQLRAGVGMRPSRARYKIYIIDEVHMLTQQAFNALLKTLEEPPEHVKFIFCTTDPEKIPITVLSRCQRFDFAPVETEAILARLEEIVQSEGCQADQDALRLLARRAAGSMRDSQSLLEQVLSFATDRITVDQVHSMLGTADDTRLSALAVGLIDRDPAAVLKMVDDAVMGGIDAGQLAEQLLGYFRDLMTATVGCGVDMLRHAAPGSYDDLAAQGNRLGIHTILVIVGIIDQAITRMRQSVHSRVLLEAALVQICRLADLQAISDVVAGLRQVSAGGAAPVQPAAVEKKNIDLASNAPAAASVPPANVARSASPAGSAPPPAANAAPPAAVAPNAPAPAPSSSVPAPAAPRPVAAPTAVAERPASGGAAVSPPAAASPSPPGPVSRPAAASQNAAAAVAVQEPPSNNGAPAASGQWDAEYVRSMWRGAIASLDDMTANYAKNAQRVEPAGDGAIRVYFPSARSLDKVSCEKPERRSKLEAALAAVAKRHVHYDCFLIEAPPSQKPVRRALTSADRARRQREVEQEPIIAKMMELFDAEVVKVIPAKEED